MTDLAVRYEAHVDERFKLDVRAWGVGMQVQLVRLLVAFTSDLNHIVVVALGVTLELDVKFDGQARRDIADVLVVDPKIGSLRLRELEALKVLGDVADSHRDLVVLGGLDV